MFHRLSIQTVAPATSSARRAGPLALALVVACAASQAAAQVDPAAIDAALGALERSVGVVAAPVAVPTAPPQVVQTTTPPPGSVADLQAAPAATDRIAGGIDFLPILTDQDCPQRIVDVGEQAEIYAREARAAEARMLKLDDRFARLEARNREAEKDPDALECAVGLVDDLRELQADLGELDLAVMVQQAETLSVCTQQGRQAVDARIATLSQSDDPTAAQDRLALGGILERWATADVQVSAAVSSFVFYDQRRIRLETATGSILRRCDFLGEAYQ